MRNRQPGAAALGAVTRCVPRPRLPGTSGTTCGTWGGRGGRGVGEVKGVMWELLLPSNTDIRWGSRQADEAAGPRPAGRPQRSCSQCSVRSPPRPLPGGDTWSAPGPGALPSGTCFLRVLVPQGTSPPRLFPGRRFRPGLSASVSRRPARRLRGPGDSTCGATPPAGRPPRQAGVYAAWAGSGDPVRRTLPAVGRWAGPPSPGGNVASTSAQKAPGHGADTGWTGLENV